MKRNQIHLEFNNYSGLGKIKKLKNDYVVRYDINYSILSWAIMISTTIYFTHEIYINKSNTDLQSQAIIKLFFWLLLSGIAIKTISYIFKPFGKFLMKTKTVNLEKDIIHAIYENTTNETISKTRVAAKFASLAMAGVLSNQGKKAGRNIYLGAAAAIPSTKTESLITIAFIHKNGNQGAVTLNGKNFYKIKDSISSYDAPLVKEYLTYLSDAKTNKTLTINEITENIKNINQRLEQLQIKSSSASTAEQRQKAVSDYNETKKRLILLQILLNEI